MVTIAQAGDQDDRTLRTALRIIAVLAEAARQGIGKMEIKCG
jgi:hypothetical protein